MLNVNQITSQLSGMPDQALQQFATMHKNDPYTLALAVSESNRRKQMRAGAQAGVAGQKQPTVADQAIAGMNAAPQPQAGGLPEDQGIGALPAPNMAKMADGGIVGYAGGIPENTFLTPERMAAADAAYAAGWNQNPRPTYYNPASQAALHPFGGPSEDDGKSSTLGQFLLGIPEWLSGGKKGEAERAQQEQRLQLERQRINADPGLLSRLTPAERAERMAQVNAIDAQLAQLRGTTPSAKPTPGQAFPTSVAPQVTPGATAPAVTAPAGQFTDTRTAPPKPPGKTKSAAATTSAAPKDEGLEAIYAKLEKLGGDKETKQGIKGYQDEVDASIAALKTAREEGRPQGEAYAAYKASLDKDAAAAQGKEDKNLKMALINAGLAMMGGKSQYALQNIAEGAQVGTKQYQAGLDKLEEAAKARQKEEAMIEQARRSEARGDWKDTNEFNQKANEAGLASKKFGISAVAEITGATRKEAATMYGKQQELVQHEREHRETMASQEKIAGMYAANRGTAGAVTPALALKEYNDLVAKDIGGEFQARYPTSQAYMAALGIGNMPGAAAPVNTAGFKVLR